MSSGANETLILTVMLESTFNQAREYPHSQGCYDGERKAGLDFDTLNIPRRSASKFIIRVLSTRVFSFKVNLISTLGDHRIPKIPSRLDPGVFGLFPWFRMWYFKC